LCITSTIGEEIKIKDHSEHFSIESFDINKPGYYFENYGPTRLVGGEYTLMAYLSLTEYNEKYEYLEKSISELNENCKKDDKHRLICSKFDNIITGMFTEISMQRENIIISLGRDEIKREKRGAINIIGNALHVLFGVCDDECTKKVNRALIEQQKNSGNVLHLMKKQTTLVKTTMQRIGASIEETQQLHEELRGKQQELVKRMNSLTNVTNDVLDLLLFNSVQNLHLALINQYAYETLMLNQIITAARTGVIHTSLLTPKDLSETLNDIAHRLRTKMHLPMGTIPNELYELRKIIKITTIYTQDKLLFVIKIPLVTEIELTMYNAIPVPMMGNVTYILKPEQPFIAITKDRRQFTTFTSEQIRTCTETNIFRICNIYQPIRDNKATKQCEVELFHKPEKVPDECEPHAINLNRNIYHKLRFRNEWLFATTNDTLTINCANLEEATIIRIKGTGIIKINDTTCEVSAENVILTATQEITNKKYINFVPVTNMSMLTTKFPKKLHFAKLKSINNTIGMKLNHLGELSHSVDNLEELISKEEERQRNEQHKEIHSNLIYVTLILGVLSMVLIIIVYVTIKYKIKCYKNKQNIEEPKIYKLSKRNLEDYELGNIEERNELEVEEEGVYPHISNNHLIR